MVCRYTPADNSWNIELLDLRPITLSMVSTSKDPQMAANAVSYGGEDGTEILETTTPS